MTYNCDIESKFFAYFNEITTNVILKICTEPFILIRFSVIDRLSPWLTLGVGKNTVCQDVPVTGTLHRGLFECLRRLFVFLKFSW